MSFPVLQKIDSNVSEMVQFPSNVLIKNIQIKIEAISCKSMGEYFDFITIIFLLNTLMMPLIC